MNILRAQSISTFKKLTTAAITLALLAASLIAASPAHAGLVDGSGTLACSASGTVTVASNIVTGSTDCAGEVVLPSGVTEIGASAFYMAPNLQSVTFPDTVAEIRTNAFAYSEKLTRLIFIGNAPGVGFNAFDGIGANATVTIGENANFVSGSTSYITGDVWKTALVVVRAPDVACSDGGYVNLTGIVVESVYYCTGEVTVPNGVLGINDGAFRGQAGLTKITLPESLTTIGVSAFEDATNLARFVFLGNAPDVDVSSFLGVPYLATAAISSSATGFRVDQTLTGYRWYVLWLVKDPDFACSNGGWVLFNPTTHTVMDGSNCKGIALIPEGVTAIADEAFSGNTVLTEVSLPASLTSIGVNAFMRASALRTATFRDPENSALSTIGANAFSEATSLTSMYIPAGVTLISTSAFFFTGALTSVTFEGGSTLSTIGENAFNSSGLTSIELPASVNYIYTNAFSGSSNLANVRFLGSTPPNVGATPFARVKAAATAEVLDGVTAYGDVRDLWNNLLVKIENQSTVPCLFEGTETGYFVIDTTTAGAFSLVYGSPDCAGTVTVPAEVTFIEMNAFENGSEDRGQITSIVFEANSLLTVIGEAAFAGLVNLSTIELPAGVQSIGDRAFDGDALLTEIILPASVTSIGDNAFAGIALRSVTFLGDAPVINPLHDPFIDAPVAYARAFVAAGATGFGVSGNVWNGLNVLRSPDVACAQNGFVTVSGTVLRDGRECVGSVAIPSSVTEISARAFAGSVIPGISFLEDSALTTIGESAFEGALSLDRLSLAANVSFIGANAFKNTPGLKYFTVDGGNSSFSSSADQVLFNRSKSKLIAYPAARPVNTNRQYTGPSTQASYNVPATVTEIAESAFYNASNIREIIFPGDAPTVGADAFYGVGAGATAKITLNATGFGDGPTWNGLTIVRAAAPSVSSPGSTSVTPPVVTPPVVVAPKPVAKPIALSQIVAKLLANGVPVLKGRSASKQVEFTASSARLDATDWATLRKVAASFTGKKGKLILVGFANGKGQTKGSAQKVAAARAKNVAMALVSLGVDFEIGYAGFGARNKANPTTIDNRVDFRWIAAE